MRRLWLLVLLSACAHAPVSPENAPHGSRAAKPTEPIALPFRLHDGQNGKVLTSAAFSEKLLTACAIFVGEEHTNPHDHAVQIDVLQRAYATDHSVALGMEMLPTTMQPELDRYLSGEIDEEKFLSDVDWNKTWGYPFGFYRPMLHFCQEHKLRVYALNAPRSITHTIAKLGLDGVSEEDRKLLPELHTGPAAHREFAREAFGAHPKGKFNDAAFERFYTAQLVWDETMADSIARALNVPGAAKRIVVVAGEGHVRKWAVPDRAARRGIEPYLTIVPLFEKDVADARQDQIADVLWVYNGK